MLTLRKKKVESCRKCSSLEQRRSLQNSNDYCSIVKTSDGLGARCVGEWGTDKVTFLATYVDIVGIALKRTWSNYYYIEICSGPGLCIDYHSAEEFLGTAMASLLTKGAKHFTKFFFFDINPRTVEYLQKRIATDPDIPEDIKHKAIVKVADYRSPETIIGVLREYIPNSMKGLNVVFVDPTDMSVPFSLYQKLLEFNDKVDFIINFADNTDLRRNIVLAFEDTKYPINKKYREVLENSDFFLDPENIKLAEENNIAELCDRFEKIFLGSFVKRGFTHILEKRIRSFYKLVYLSKSEKGKKFWKIASEKTAVEVEYGQKTLPL